MGTRQAPSEHQLAEWREERDALCRTLLANPNDPARAKVEHRLHVLSFLMKRYNVLETDSSLADLGAAPDVGELDLAAIKPVATTAQAKSGPDPLRWERDVNRVNDLIRTMAADVPEADAIESYQRFYREPPEPWMLEAARQALHERDLDRAVYFRRCLEKGMSVQLASVWYEWEVGQPPLQWMIVEAFRAIEKSHQAATTITEDEILEILSAPARSDRRR